MTRRPLGVFDLQAVTASEIHRLYLSLPKCALVPRHAALTGERSAYIEVFIPPPEMAPSAILVEESSSFALWAIERVLELVRNVGKTVKKEGQAGAFYTLFESHLVLIQVWLQDHPNEAERKHITEILSLLQSVCDVCFLPSSSSPTDNRFLISDDKLSGESKNTHSTSWDDRPREIS